MAHFLSTRVRAVSLAMIAGLLGGCATPTAELPGVSDADVAAERERQKLFVAQDYFLQRERLFRVASQVNAANVEMCKDRVASEIGVDAVRLSSLKPLYRTALVQRLGGGRYPPEAVVVTGVAPGSPAEAAGLMRGDQLPDDADRTAGRKRDSAKKIGLIGYQPRALTVTRAGAPMTLTMAPRRTCDYAAEVEDSAEVNAHADGEGIVVSKGALRFAAADQELAVMYGHELAHNVMGHIDSKEQNLAVGAVAGAAVDILLAVGGVNSSGAFMKMGANTGASAYSQEFEKEADYVGLYLTQRAGFDVSAAPNIWRRMAVETSTGAISYGGTHPTTPERYLILDRTMAEISDKSARNVALLPNQAERPAPVEGGGVTRAALRQSRD